MVKCLIFAVSSVRDYGDGELYFGTDGVFRTRQEAEEYIREDVRETLLDYRELFDTEIPSGCVDEETNDYSDFSIRFDGHTFLWRIDVFNTDRFCVAE